MKYNPKSNNWKASNVVYEAEHVRAWSYDWWCFLKIIEGRVIFNDFNYSNTTRKHQSKVRRLIQELGLKVDRSVKIAKGLQNINTLSDLNRAESETLDMLASRKEAQRVARNLKARESREARKAREASHVCD